MRLILLTNFYPPEVRSISTMMQELAEALVERGHDVTVITSWPRENVSPDSAIEKSIEDITERGVRVIRVKVPSSYSKNYILRGFAHLTIPYFFWRAVLRLHHSSINGVIVYTPHLPLACVGAKIKRVYGARFLLNIQDIFPQNAIDSGIMRNRFFIRFFEWMERHAYLHADVLTTHTNGGRLFLMKRKSIPKEKISTIFNWIDPEPFDKALDTGTFRRQYRLERTFIFLFAGIFGPTQYLEFIIEVARRVVDISDVRFLMIGGGTEKWRLEKLVKDCKLSNISFGSLISPQQYPALLKEVDVGLLCLAPQNTTAVVPGKLWGFMAARLPVLAFLQEQSEGHRIIREAQCGYSIVSDSIDAAEEVVRKIVQERQGLREYGQRGYEYALEHFSRVQCIDQLERLLVDK